VEPAPRRLRFVARELRQGMRKRSALWSQSPIGDSLVRRSGDVAGGERGYLHFHHQMVGGSENAKSRSVPKLESSAFHAAACEMLIEAAAKPLVSSPLVSSSPGELRLDDFVPTLGGFSPAGRQGDRSHQVRGRALIRKPCATSWWRISAPPPTPAREAPGNQSWKSNFLAIVPDLLRRAIPRCTVRGSRPRG
jgi:hypothetical protein